jgi:hypothetical protein
LLILRPPKRTSKLHEKPSALKKNIQHFKKMKFSYLFFFLSILPFTPTKINAGPGSDRKHCAEECQLLFGESILCGLQVPGPKEKREEAEQVHKKFAANEGDLLTLLNVWKAYRSLTSSSLLVSFCFL